MWLNHPPRQITADFSLGLPKITLPAEALAGEDMSAWFQTQKDWVLQLRLSGEESTFEEASSTIVERGLLDWIITLKIGCRGLTDAGLESFARLANLENLTIEKYGPGDARITGRGLRHLAGLPQLRELCLAHMELTDEHMEGLGHLQQLQTLEFKGCGYAGLSAAGATPADRFPRLQNLVLAGSDLTDSVLCYFCRFNGLRRIRLEHARDVTEVGMAHLARLPELRVLEIANAWMSDGALGHISRLNKLRSLQILNPPSYNAAQHSVTDVGLESVARLRELRSLTLRKCRISDAGLLPLARLTELQELDLRGSPVTYAGLKQLTGLTQLHDLRLSESIMTDASLQELAGLVTARKHPYMGKLLHPRILRVGAAATEAGLGQLPAFTQVRELSLGRPLMLGEGLQQLAGLKLLRTVNLEIDRDWIADSQSVADSLNDKVLRELAGLAQLRQLNLHVHLSDAGLRHLADLMSRRCDLKVNVSIYRDQASDAFLEALAEYMRRLRSLPRLPQLDFGVEVECDAVSDAGLSHVAGLKQMRDLDLSHCRVTVAGLKHLAGLTGLRRLDLSGCDITDEGLSHLAGLTNLEYLDADHNQVSDTGLKYLSGLSRLESLDLYRSANITDAGMVHLAGLTRLRLLNLAYSRITDAGLLQLAGLTRLRDLWLGDAPVTRQGVSKFKESVVDCYVTYGG